MAEHLLNPHHRHSSELLCFLNWTRDILAIADGEEHHTQGTQTHEVMMQLQPYPG